VAVGTRLADWSDRVLGARSKAAWGLCCLTLAAWLDARLLGSLLTGFLGGWAASVGTMQEDT